MAKLKDKINDLKTKYGISEDAAREVLSLHEGDLTEASAMVAAEQAKVVGWNQWYQEKAPQIAAALDELEALRAYKANVERATNPTPTPSPTPTPNPAQPANLEQVEKRIYDNFSAVQRDIYNIQRHHMQNYKELPDLEPIEKLIQEKNLTPWAAYQEWVAPLEKERTTKELTEKITAELTQKFQNEATRSGVNGYLLSNKSALTGEEVTSPLDEVAREQAQKNAVNPTPSKDGPSDLELMADFVGTMRQGRAGNVH